MDIVKVSDALLYLLLQRAFLRLGQETEVYSGTARFPAAHQIKQTGGNDNTNTEDDPGLDHLPISGTATT